MKGEKKKGRLPVRIERGLSTVIKRDGMKQMRFGMFENINAHICLK